MFNSKKEEFERENNVEGLDDENQRIEDGVEESDIEHQARSEGLTERLRDFFRNEGDGDLLLQQSDRDENVMQWLQALDLQVMGACRADERLKPLLKINVSGGFVEDNLLAQLSQHFEVPEVGMLARCLCIPLVSIRVGRVIKQGRLLCPTGIRGNLNLILLPSSDFRLSFIGDDGFVERLVTLNSDSESSVVIEEIPDDKSGRSFFVEYLGGQVSYFWCSEKSKLTGFELLSKMKDVLRKKPSLAELTGIRKSRLDCFATHFRAYCGSAVSDGQVNPTVTSIPLEWDSSIHSSSSVVKPSRPRQGSLSPRSNSFKEGAPRNLSSRIVAKEKFKRRVDNSCCFSTVETLSIVPKANSVASTSSHNENNPLPEISQSLSLLPVSFLDSLGSSAFSPSSSFFSLSLPMPQTPAMGSSLFSPYYCWCPPCTSTLQYTVTPLQQTISSSTSLPLPPLSSLISAARSFVSSPLPLSPLNLTDFSPLNFPAFAPDPVVQVPLPISSLITMPISQQIPTFTPLMCDPIVHVPVIDVCSSGQGYLVSAGPTISTTIPPLCAINQMIPETESLVEKGARETLRLLLGSTQTDSPLLDVLPSVLTSKDEKHSITARSRGFYSGTRDVEAIANSIAAMGLVSLPHFGGDIASTCSCDYKSHDGSQGSGDRKGPYYSDKNTDDTMFNDDDG